MKTNFRKIISMVLLLAVGLSTVVIVPTSAATLTSLPDAGTEYKSGVFIACRTLDKNGNEKNPMLFSAGQTVVFELAAYDSNLNRLAVETFAYALYDDAHGNTAFESGFVTADPETGVGLVEVVAMDQPGMLRITADVADAEGNLLREYRTAYSSVMLQGAVLIDAQSVTTVSDEPADFDQFWEDSIALLPSADLVGLKEIAGPSGYKCYEVYINCYGLESDTKSGDTFTAGYLTIPEGATKGSLGIQVEYQGQGLAGLSVKTQGKTIMFNCLAHSVDLAALAEYEAANPSASKSDKYNEFLNLAEDDKAVWGEDTYGMSPTVNADREKVYYRQMLLRDYQAVEFLTKYFASESTAAEYNGIDISSWAGLWNGQSVTVTGGSQGGFQAIGVAALHPAVTYLNASIPWLCDIGAGTTKVPVDTYIGSGNRPAYAAGLDYVDSAFLAKRITCKTNISAGLGDPTCPPSGVMAMYNNLTSGKTAADGPYTLSFIQSMPHGFNSAYGSATTSFLKTYSVGTQDGAIGTDAYVYTIEGSVLNIVSESDAAILKVDDELIELAIANAETIRTIEIEGEFAAIGSLEAALKYFTRVENIKIDVATTTLAEDATNVFAGAANLASLGHVEFDAVGAPVADTGTYKKGVVNLSGFDAICDGILSGDRAVTTVVLADANIPANAFTNAVSLEEVTVIDATSATIDASAFSGTSGVKIVVADETAKATVEAALEASAIDNVTVEIAAADAPVGDKTGAAGTDAKWKIKGSTLIISGTGAVTKLEGLTEDDKVAVNNIVISDGITSVSDGVIDGFTLERVTLKGTVLPTANDGVFGVQSAEFVVYVTPDAENVGATLYGYAVEVDGAPAGDINGDGDINAKDSVLLAQILAGWTVEYKANAADCNGDGEINAKDSVLLAQYLAGWEVNLGVTTGDGDIEIPGSDLLD